MTLAELLPSLAHSVPPDLDPALWPAGTTHTDNDDVLFAGMPLTHLAARFGTPVNLLDERQVRARARAFRATLPEAEVAFAGKSLPCKGVLRWLADEGLSLDVCSAGELAAARAVGFPAERILLHGNVRRRRT